MQSILQNQSSSRMAGKYLQWKYNVWPELEEK